MWEQHQPLPVSFIRTVSWITKVKMRVWGVYELDLGTHRFGNFLGLFSLPLRIAAQVQAGLCCCVIPKTCGCCAFAINEVTHFIQVNKIQFSKVLGTQWFLVPQTVKLNCRCSTSSSPAGRLSAHPEVSVHSPQEEWEAAECPHPRTPI